MEREMAEISANSQPIAWVEIVPTRLPYGTCATAEVKVKWLYLFKVKRLYLFKVKRLYLFKIKRFYLNG